MDFDIFGLRYVLKHSESIPTRKLRPKFLWLIQSSTKMYLSKNTKFKFQSQIFFVEMYDIFV